MLANVAEFMLQPTKIALGVIIANLIMKAMF